jgi:hypothetical protein
MDKWIVENPDTSAKLPYPSKIERKFDYISLDRCQQVGKRAEKETIISLAICTHLQKAMQTMIQKCHPPHTDELRKIDTMEQLLDKIQKNTNHIHEVTKVATKETIELMGQHLIQPAKVHTMIQEFMATLAKDMRTLSHNIVVHEASLE